jgi:phosphoglycerate dehydrogenase-like enzyme
MSTERDLEANVHGKIKAGVNTSRTQWEYVFSPETREQLHELLDFDESLIPENSKDTEAVARSVTGARVVLSTWGAQPYTPALLDTCPDLELVLYGAGSVKGFVTEELSARKVTVCSAVHLNARPVAEFVLGIILSSLKNVFAIDREMKERGRAGWHRDKMHFPGGYYGSSVGLLGYGRVTRALLERLEPFDFQVYLNDPHLSENEIEALGVRPATQDWIMANCDVVSLHHGNTPDNRHMINRTNLELLKPGARFINTARGQLVDEDALVERLSIGDVTAFLDVTYPEPPEEGHPFYTLPNCILTPHIAGSVGREVHRMGDYCLRELRHWLAGETLENPIDLATVQERG